MLVSVIVIMIGLFETESQVAQISLRLNNIAQISKSSPLLPLPPSQYKIVPSVFVCVIVSTAIHQL